VIVVVGGLNYMSCTMIFVATVTHWTMMNEIIYGTTIKET
jgi:hypothetical protein